MVNSTDLSDFAACLVASLQLRWPRVISSLGHSDIITPPSRVRSLSNSTSIEEDDSVLNSIFSKITGVEGRSRATAVPMLVLAR